MRVLHVAASLADEWGGPVTVLRNLIASMTRLGVESTVLATTGHRVGIGEALDGVSTHLASTSQLSRVWTAHSTELRSVLPGLVKSADLVHIHELWHYPHWAAHRLARQHHIPYIVTPHGELDPWRLRQKAWKKAPYLALIQRSVLQHAAAVHAITDAEVNEIVSQVPGANTRVIPNGVDVDSFRSLPPRSRCDKELPELRGKRVILFLGRLHKVKGLDLLAHAFASMPRGREDVFLVVAGPDEGFKGAAEAILASAGVSQQAIFTGMVTGERKLQLLGAADVFVLPSYGEGFSTTVLEAMACGIPVIISKQCKFPEVADAGAGLVVSTDAGELKQALQEVLDHPEEARAMGERGKELAREEYSWDAVASQMLDLYQDVVERKHSRSAVRAIR